MKRVNASVEIPDDLAAEIEQADRVLREHSPDFGGCGIVAQRTCSYSAPPGSRCGAENRVPGTLSLHQCLVIAVNGPDRSVTECLISNGRGDDDGRRIDDAFITVERLRTIVRWVLDGQGEMP